MNWHTRSQHSCISADISRRYRTSSRRYTIAALVIMMFSFSSLYAQEHVDITQKWQNATAYTLELVDLVPDSSFSYRPTPQSMSFAQQMLHMAANMVWLSRDHLGYQNAFPHQITSRQDTDPAIGPGQVRTILKDALQYAAEAIEAIPPADWDEPVAFFVEGLNRRRIVWLLCDHLTHHRAQIIVYLRLAGVDPPRYVGW